MDNLYETILSLCKEKGITITDMCSASGASRGSLSDLKTGRKKSLSIETLSKISTFFDVPLDFLAENPPYDKWEEINKSRKEFLICTHLHSGAILGLWGITLDNIYNLPITKFIKFLEEAIKNVDIVNGNSFKIEVKGAYKSFLIDQETGNKFGKFLHAQADKMDSIVNYMETQSQQNEIFRTIMNTVLNEMKVREDYTKKDNSKIIADKIINYLETLGPVAREEKEKELRKLFNTPFELNSKVEEAEIEKEKYEKIDQENKEDLGQETVELFTKALTGFLKATQKDADRVIPYI
jgi:transcriptional regulator with XRE-family HTH domain